MVTDAALHEEGQPSDLAVKHNRLLKSKVKTTPRSRMQEGLRAGGLEHDLKQHQEPHRRLKNGEKTHKDKLLLPETGTRSRTAGVTIPDVWAG